LEKQIVDRKMIDITYNVEHKNTMVVERLKYLRKINYEYKVNSEIEI